jgi:glycosyltransferase involved in cell wall biosynthesis
VVDASVVIPTHNRSAFLALAVASVLRQQDVSIEVIVVDEASTDATAEVLAQASDARVRVIRHDTPRGVARARNHGWQSASGEWIAFIDDDDLWAPEKLASQLAAARASGRDWAYVGSINIDERGRILSGQPPPPPELVVRYLHGYNAIPGGGSNVVARRTLLDAVGPFDARHYNTEDWDMWLRLARRGPPAWVPRPLLAYRVHTSGASLKTEAILAGAALIEQTHATAIDYGVLHRWFAESSLRQRKRGDALRHLVLAAALGQTRGVADDLAAIARRRVRRLLGRVEPPSIDRNGWCAQAQGWLDELTTPT